MDKNKPYKIATEWTDKIPGRKISNDIKLPFNGVDFQKDVLNKHYKENPSKMIIDLDGTFGYPESFLDDAFGGFAREHGIETALNFFEFISLDMLSLPEEIKEIIKTSSEE